MILKAEMSRQKMSVKSIKADFQDHEAQNGDSLKTEKGVA